MAWEKKFFVDNARLYAPLLESRESKREGEHIAMAIRRYLKGKGIDRGNILDAPCGTGRVAIPLAKHYRVTGIDISPYFIRIARKNARMKNAVKNTRFILGDMKRLDKIFKEGKVFDAAINVYTSIGYGSVADDMKFFRSLRKLVKEGGFFIIYKLKNGEEQLKNPLPKKDFLYFASAGDMLVHERPRFNPKTRRYKNTWKFYRRMGKNYRFVGESGSDVRIYLPGELRKMLSKTGWKVIGIFEDLEQGKAASERTRYMTIVARPK